MIRTITFLIAVCWTIIAVAPAEARICGDINDNAEIDISDLMSIVGFMFQDGPPLPYPPQADCDGNHTLDIADLICWVSWMFQNGPSPSCSFQTLALHEENSGPCLSDSAAALAHVGNLRLGDFSLTVDGNDVHVNHDRAFYQCCFMYNVEYLLDGSEIVGFEQDTGQLCDCYCLFDLTSIVSDLSPGEYSLCLIGIEGDTVGCQAFSIAFGADFELDLDNGGCQRDWPWEGDPIVNYSYDQGMLTIDHPNAFFNCGAIITMEFCQVGDTLRFFERNQIGAPLPCMCSYPLTASVSGLVPGEYVAEVWNRDEWDTADYVLNRQVITLEP